MAVRSSRRSPIQCWRAALLFASRRGGDLGHVHHCLDTSFAGRLGEDGDGVEQAWSNRVAEIRSRASSQRRADGMEVEKITDNDLGTGRGQALGTRVAAVDEGSDTVSTLKQQAHRGIAPCSRSLPVIRNSLSFLVLMQKTSLN